MIVNKERYSDLNRKYKHYKYLCFFAILLNTILLGFISSISDIYTYEKPKYSETPLDKQGIFDIENNSFQNLSIKIDYGNLTYNEIRNVQILFDRINPIYLNYIKSISYIDGINPEGFNENCIEYNIKEDTCTIGRNSNNNLILIYHKSSTKEVNFKENAELLCHEILHSLINMEPTLDESLVDDLEKKLVCYY